MGDSIRHLPFEVVKAFGDVKAEETGGHLKGGGIGHFTVCYQVHDLSFAHAGLLRTGNATGAAEELHTGGVQSHASAFDESLAFGGGVREVFEVGGQIGADVVNVIQSFDIDETEAPEFGKQGVRDIRSFVGEDEEHMDVPGTTALRFGSD